MNSYHLNLLRKLDASPVPLRLTEGESYAMLTLELRGLVGRTAENEFFIRAAGKDVIAVLR